MEGKSFANIMHWVTSVNTYLRVRVNERVKREGRGEEGGERLKKRTEQKEERR
jgi:hypothetical protein